MKRMTNLLNAPRPDPVAPTNGTAEPAYYSITQAAALLRVSRVSIWRWISAGRLPVLRLGHRTVRIRREDLELIIQPLRASQPEVASLPGDSASTLGLLPGSSDHLVVFYHA